MTTDPATIRLTVAQALVRFLSVQYSERDGETQRLIPGVFGIFGHGNVAGIGQALLQNATAPGEAVGPEVPAEQPVAYYQARNEQNMVHTAVGFARARNRLQTLACTSSIGPGSTNMVTGAALATIDHIPALLLPSDTFATRRVDPALQQLEDERALDMSVNDAFRPVSRFFDRIDRPEQLIAALPAAMRVLTDPAETGAVTICLPQDVQAEAYDWPLALFRERVWHVARPVPDRAAITRAAQQIRSAQRPLIVAGGGAVYSDACAQVRAFAEGTGIPVADTQAGKGAIDGNHELAVGGIGATGADPANTLAARADLVIGVGTRYTDFTTASRTAFADPDVRFVNLNVKAFDAAKHAAEMVVCDAREGLEALTRELSSDAPYATDAAYRVEAAYRAEAAELNAAWRERIAPCFAAHDQELPAQTEIFGALNELMGQDDVVVNAAGSMPGDLQALWTASGPGQYHLEYGYSCMGYEIPASLGVRLARPEGEVVAIVGDGSFQMAPQEIATLVAEGLKVTMVILQNHGWSSIGSLSESHGSQRFGTRYRMRNEASGMLDGPQLPMDITANLASYGLDTVEVSTTADFRAAYRRAAESDRAAAIVVNTDLYGPNPPGIGWWDVPVGEVSALDSTRQARAAYESESAAQRYYL